MCRYALFIYMRFISFVCVCVCACDCPWAFRASHSNSIFFIICQKQYASCRSQLRECVTRHQRFVTEAFLWAVVVVATFVVGFCQLCNIASIRQTGILLSATCCCYCKCWYLFYNNKGNLSPRCALVVTLFESFFSNCMAYINVCTNTSTNIMWQFFCLGKAPIIVVVVAFFVCAFVYRLLWLSGIKESYTRLGCNWQTNKCFQQQ